MDEQEQQNLQERLDRLEKRVEQLEGKRTEGKDSLTVSLDEGEGPYEAPPESGSERKAEGSSLQKVLLSGESWLNRIGIALLLLGVVFLFKYSVDQGWLVPPVRSLIGLGIGLLLFTAGLYLDKVQSPIKQICLGGGIGVFYITGFATFQLYAFVSSPVVWAFMIIVTILAISLSLQQDEPILSVVGVLGGLGTPFMLYTGSGSLASLIIYTALILSASSAIYLVKGWVSLLWAMVAGGWLVMLAGFYNSLIDVLEPVWADRFSLQAGILLCLASFWVVPMVRELGLKKGRIPFGADVSKEGYESAPSARIAALVIPVLAFLYSMALWELTAEAWGVIALAFSMVVGYLYLPLRNEGLEKLASIHGFGALVLLTISFYLLLEGDLLFVVLALEGLGLRILADQTGDSKISLGSHVLMGAVGMWLLEDLTVSIAGTMPILNMSSLTQLTIIGIGGLAIPSWIREQSGKGTYRFAAHLALLGWFYSELHHLDNGQAYISLCWGAYALGLLVIGIVNRLEMIRMAAIGTIFLVVAKLFFVDLSKLEAIWRILLFIGFGGVLLIISYYLQEKLLDHSERE